MLIIVLGFSDAVAKTVPEVLHIGQDMISAKAVLKSPPAGIARTHLLVNPMIHQIKRFSVAESPPAEVIPVVTPVALVDAPAETEVTTEDVVDAAESEERVDVEDASDLPLDLPRKRK